MYKRTDTAGWRTHSKKLVLLLSLMLLLGAAAGGTIAYLATQTQKKENTFTPSKVTSTVEESFSGDTKSNVTVKNTGDTKAFIRAMIVVSWKDAQGNVYGEAPGTDDYTIVYGGGWTQQGDYWYCDTPIDPGANTPVLIASCTPVGEAPDGYGLSVEIIADAIQSAPLSAVQEAWNYNPGGN